MNRDVPLASVCMYRKADETIDAKCTIPREKIPMNIRPSNSWKCVIQTKPSKKKRRRKREREGSCDCRNCHHKEMDCLDG
jgi:hypothetical protein